MTSLDLYKDGSTGDMYYRSSTGLLLPVSGTASTGYVPTKQADGTVAWGAASAAGGRTLISSQTLGAAAATVTFSSIPGTYADLEIWLLARGTNASETVELRMRFNGDTGANYHFSKENRFGATTGSAQTYMELASLAGASNTASGATATRIVIPNYVDTNWHRMCQAFTWVQFTAGNGTIVNAGGTRRNTAALTQIDLLLSAGNFATNSAFRLYGLG